MKEDHHRGREEELAEVIHASREPLVVYIGEDYHPGVPEMLERTRAVCRARRDIKLMDLTLHACRQWAAGHGVFGTPSILVFREGRAVAVILGVVEPEELEERLRQVL